MTSHDLIRRAFPPSTQMMFVEHSLLTRAATPPTMLQSLYPYQQTRRLLRLATTQGKLSTRSEVGLHQHTLLGDPVFLHSP